MSNRLRAQIIALAQSVFPVIVLIGVDLSDDAIAAIMLVITNTITLLALIFPGKEEVVVVEPVERAQERDLLVEQRAAFNGIQRAFGDHDAQWVERNAEI